MNIKHIKLTAYAASAIFLASCGAQKPANSSRVQPKKSVAARPTVPKPITKPADEETEPRNLQLPQIPREFRAAWVATVANINWPSKGNYSTAQQKREAVEILDMLKDANFNAVIFQARPSSDALYQSDLEPWSYFLTGSEGTPPSPFYDPLEFWIDEAHKRGMELHVWLNPYRAHHTSGGEVSASSIARRMPQQAIRLKNGMYWLDPSDDKVQDHVSAVIKDMVRRYDLDAIHIDDYFYPYKDYNGGADFPDSRTWEIYRNSGGTLTKGDWRRANVNKFIKRIHDEIKAEKPYVKFGISPFGIWKPGHPAGVTGSSQYDELFADAKLWLNQGWCDYFSPQLYWKEGGAQSFSSLLSWWKQETPKTVHLWPGLNTIGVKTSLDKTQEIAGQIATARNILGRDAGEVHYSVYGISKNSAMLQTVKNMYREAALIPASPWIKSDPVVKPEVTVEKAGSNAIVRWLARNTLQARHFVLFAKYGTAWQMEIFGSGDNSKSLPLSRNGVRLTDVAVKTVDRNGNESDYAAVEIH